MNVIKLDESQKPSDNSRHIISSHTRTSRKTVVSLSLSLEGGQMKSRHNSQTLINAAHSQVHSSCSHRGGQYESCERGVEYIVVAEKKRKLEQRVGDERRVR